MKTIVKYGNRKLYDRETSKYTTLHEIVALPMGAFKVVKRGHGDTEHDITTETLLSALAEASVQNDVKVQVMQYCIDRLTV